MLVAIGTKLPEVGIHCHSDDTPLESKGAPALSLGMSENKRSMCRLYDEIDKISESGLI